VTRVFGHVYVLVDPRDGEIRYVGWTSRTLRQRHLEHMYARSKTHRSHWLSLLKQQGMAPFIRLLQTLPIAEAKKSERYWIDYFRSIGCRLVNGTDGGEGSLGRAVSTETRAKISATKKANPRKFTPEQRARISAQVKARGVSPETRAKLSAFMKTRVLKPESRAKQAEKLRGRPVPMERRTRISAAMKAKGIQRSDEYRQKQSASQLKRYQDPAERLRQSTQQRGHAVTEETRQKLRDFWAEKRRLHELETGEPAKLTWRTRKR
jgi:hypothetical protein